MRQDRYNTLPTEVDSVREQFRVWRATRKAGSAMPEALWDAAVHLAKEHGPGVISRALPMDYGALKRRMETDESPCFVELTSAQLCSPSETVGPVVEVVEADGSRMTIRLTAGDRMDFVGLVNAFRRRCA